MQYTQHVASRAGYVPRRRAARLEDDDPDVVKLKALCASRRAERNSVARFQLSKLVTKQKRIVNRKRAQARYAKTVSEFSKFGCCAMSAQRGSSWDLVPDTCLLVSNGNSREIE